MTQILKDVLTVLEDVKSGKITNREGLSRVDEIDRANRYNLLSGVTGAAEQVLFVPGDAGIDKVIKKLKGEEGSRDISYGWLRLDENHLTESERKVLEISREYVSNLDSENYFRQKESFSKEEIRILHDAAWDSKTFPLISAVAQNLLSLSKNKEQIDYENDFVIKTIKRFDSNEMISYKVIQKDQIYTICIM